jgi:hypothetical protein
MSHKSALTCRCIRERDRPEIEAWCKAQALPNVEGVEGIPRDPDEAQANVRARTCEIERRARDFEARARNRRETAELWAVRTPGGVESGARRRPL